MWVKTSKKNEIKKQGCFFFFFCTDRNNTVFFLLRKVETLNVHSPQKKGKEEVPTCITFIKKGILSKNKKHKCKTEDYKQALLDGGAELTFDC